MINEIKSILKSVAPGRLIGIISILYLAIRKAIDTTHAIESLNSVIRKSTKERKLFPTDESARKVVYLAIMNPSKRWTMPIHHWKQALNRFMIMFE
ncbi:transposase, partial [Pseudoalteromonas sp. MMG013]|nr:transposase [Pseudoalteromonas sp. MMG013]